ncbi:MAG TPA: SDR family NAD(P)-dependent oxidoreductase [Chthoniobacteraceae bacterium]|jgi:NAD(P)-dependent dehydrogenase (short-subunit alcohol dehydrogenase family)|nr:SDR family NAD(P)-dependent oxidoreductase [Chthoniobacteraceae bacterium]
MSSLNSRNALITGSSRGLGKAMALALAAAGARVALVARSEAKLHEVAREIRDAGGRAEVFVADVAEETDVERLRLAVADKFGGALHILINNAGINIRKPITDFTLAEWRSVLDTNLTSVFLLCRAFVPHMKGHGFGRIVNLTSMMSHISLPGRTAYSASKAALLGLNRALALELAADQITVNGISPGVCDTEINTPLMQNPELRGQFLAKIPVGRFGTPEEIAKLAVYLCSEDSGFITGTDIVIDGGWMAQ